MATKTITKVRIDSRRVRVSELYLSGLSQREIATELGIPRTTVQSDLNAIRINWRTITFQNYDKGLNQELAKIDLLETTAWDAWERSTQKATRETVRTRSIALDESGKPATVIETTETTETAVGDERFLNRVAWCIEKRCKLLSYDKTGQPIDIPPAQQNQSIVAMPGSTLQVNTVQKLSAEQLAAMERMTKLFPR